jgi:osmotically-inducible protein OsmY
MNRILQKCVNKEESWRFNLVLLVVISLFLSGCFGAVFSGASAVYDNYNLKRTLSNRAITMTIATAIRSDEELANSHIEVSCFDYQVLLTGQVKTQKLRKKAGDIAANTSGVEHVYDFIEERKPVSGQEALQDAWITTRVKSEIVASAEIDPSKLKIVTENGIVYLMGIVSRKQAKQITDIARYTPDVEHVVQIFKYMLYSKT